MRKYCLTILFTLVCSLSLAQDKANTDLTSRFKLWLLSNEAKAMTEIARDITLLEKSSSPFSILPHTLETKGDAETKLWATHRNLYTFIDELQSIYDLAKHFGNGKFSVILKQARPEIWGVAALPIKPFTLPRTVLNETRKAFFRDLFVTMGLDVRRDISLSNRLKATINGIKDEDYRLFREYIKVFRALYPNERSVNQLEKFIDVGLSKQFATGLTEIINSAKEVVPEVTSVKTKSGSELDYEDPLAELEALSETTSSSSSEATASQELEPPNPEESSIYDLW